MNKKKPQEEDRTGLWHFRLGWTALLVFSALGMTLELLHGFKVGWLVDVTSETRRLMWRLAHAHGTFLSLVNIVFGLCLNAAVSAKPVGQRVASFGMMAAVILVPCGFFLGGLQTYDGDPSFGIILVPLGTGAFLLALALVVIELMRENSRWLRQRSDRRP